MQCNSRYRSVAHMIDIGGDERGQEGDALGGAHIAHPTQGHSVGIELAIARDDADLAYVIVLDAEHDLRLLGRLQVHRPRRAHALDIAIVITVAIAFAVVAILFVTRDGGYGVAYPGR